MKMKSITSVLIILIMTFCANSQSLTESQSISSSGQHNLNNWYIDWYLGQNITETFSNSAISAQSGFYLINNSNVTVPELNNIVSFNLFPNPFTDYIFIQQPNFTGKYHIKIIDCHGKIWLDISIEDNTKLDLYFLPAGMYLLNLTQDNSNFKNSYKILKN